MMMGMSGGVDGMGGAESISISETPSESSVEEQIEQIKEILDWLYEVRDTIDENTWLSLTTSLEELLKELQDSQ